MKVGSSCTNPTNFHTFTIILGASIHEHGFLQSEKSVERRTSGCLHQCLRYGNAILFCCKVSRLYWVLVEEDSLRMTIVFEIQDVGFILTAWSFCGLVICLSSSSILGSQTTIYVR
jgi:hypothetical protein